MPDSMRLRTASERRAPARFGDSDTSGAVKYVDYKVPELDNLNSDFPHPVYQFGNQLARECAFPTLSFNHPGPGPSGVILKEKRKNGEVATLSPQQPTVTASTGNGEYQGEEVDGNEFEPEDQAEPTEKASLQPINRDQTTITGKPNPAIQNHDNQGLPAYAAPVEDWITAVNQHETRHVVNFNPLWSMANKVDPALPSFGLGPKDSHADDAGDWTQTWTLSSAYHLSVSPSLPDSPSPQSYEDPFVMTPKVSNSLAPEVGVSQPRRPYTVHIDRNAAKKKASELERNKNRDFELRKLGQRAPDWITLSDGVKYIITYEMTRTGMSFVQVIRTFRLTMSEAGNLMNLVGQEQRKIDSFDEEVKRHLHTADLTWMDEYNKTHTPLITDHLTAKEIRQAKAFMRFTGFEDIASKLGEYVGVGAGRRFPILLNHFWGDGFKDLPPHFKAFCSEELEKMVSTWDDGREERPPPMSTPEMHVRLDPPPGTINPRRLVNSSEPAPPAQDPPIQGHSAGETPVGEPSSGNPPVPVSSAPSSLPPNLYGRYLHGLPTVDTGYHSAIQAQPAHPVQHGLPLYLPDPRHGVPINPFATLPPPSMPHNLAHSQHGAWQPCLPVQGQPHFPQWPQRQQMYHDRGMYWTSPVPRYREPANSHFTMAIGGGQSPVQAPVIIRRPYPPPPAHYQQLPGVNIAQPGQYQQFNLSPVFGHVSKGVDVSNSEGTPPEAGPQSHFRPLGPMDNHLQQVANHGRSMGAAQNAPHHVANLPMMGFVPQRQAISSTAGLGMASAGELSRQNMASGSRLKVPLLSAAQLAFLYDTYDKPRPSMGTLNYTAAHVARSAQGNPSNPIFGAQSALQHARPAGNMEQEDSRMPDAQPVKEVSDDPLLKYSPPKIQQRDASLQKDVEEWRSKFQDTWTSESESAADNDEEEILPPMPTRPNHARKFQEDDKSDEDFVLRKDDEVQEKKKEKRVKVSLPVASRKRAASAVSASAGATKRPRRAMKRFADTAAPVSGTANKRKAAQSGESQVAPKRRRANDEASTTRASSATSRNLRRRSAPAAGGVSEGGEHDDGKKSKPAKSRRQPGGIWGNADTIFTNDRGDFLKRSEVAALPNTKYRPGGSFGGGKWQEEDTGVIWLPVNPSEQCRKNSAEKETTANCAPGAEVIGAGEKKTKKSTKASQVVKKSIRLVSQEATPSPTQIGSSQATQSSATIRNSSPAMTPETQSFEEFLSSKGLHTREMFDTDSLFRQYVSSLGPPFSTHPDAPTLASTSKVKSLDNYIPPQTRDEHETYLAAQKTAEDEGSQPQDQATQENDKPVQEQTEEKTQEYSQESTRAEAQGKPQEKSQDMSHEKPRNKSEDKSQEQSQGRPQKKSEKGIQEATPKTIGDAIKETLETTGEAAKEIQEQTPVVKEAEKNNLPELLKEQGLDLDDPPALDTTEQLGRYSKRLRSAPLGLLPRRASSSRCASPTKEPPTKEPTATVTATKQTAAKNTATKIAETKEAAAKETDIQNVVTENATTVEPVSQNLVNLETMDGVMIIRTLRPRKGKEEDRGNSPAGPSEKK